MFDAEREQRISILKAQGKANQDEMAEFSVKFYYTNQVLKLSR